MMSMDELGYIAEGLRGLAVPIDQVHEDGANARTGHAVDRIAGSLRVYGQRKPIVANRLEGGKVVAGNGTEVIEMDTERIVRVALSEWAEKHKQRIHIHMIGSGDEITIRIIDATSCIVLCARCGGRIFLEHEPKNKDYYCDKCFMKVHGDKPSTRKKLVESQGNRCIIKGCPSSYHLLGNFDVHRIVPGRKGGKYEASNCVLVCRFHHRIIEGLSRSEIGDLSCSGEQYRRITDYQNGLPVDIEPRELLLETTQDG